MTIDAFERLFEKALKHSMQILAVGPPGVGKTFVKMAVCKRLGYEYIGLSTPLQSPVKVGGYPQAPKVEGGDATHCLFNGIARAFRATKPTVLDWDDLGMGNGETLKAILDLIQFKRVDDKQLPDCVSIQGSSNDIGHGCEVQGLIEANKLRWDTIVHIEPAVDPIIAYGLANGWPAWLLAWIRNEPSCLTSWKPTKSLSIGGCTSRGIEHVAKWDLIGEDDPEVWAGAIGKGHATSARSFKELEAELPDIDQVLLDPMGAPVPENPSARFLVSMALASKMTAGNFGNCVQYLGRLPQMFRAYSIRDAFRAEASRRRDGALPQGWKPLAGSRDFTAWATSSDGKNVMAAAS